MAAAASLKIEKLRHRGIITIDHRQIWHDDVDHLRRIDRYSADWAKNCRISHTILANNNWKEPKENIYTNIILGNSNVFSL